VTLENRFKQLMASLSGVESVDALLPPGSFVGKQRADYLVANRRVVLELKTLKVDPSAKIEAELSQHRNRNDFPLIYGSVELPKILRHLPDGDKINQRIYRNISRSVETAVRGAETQISDTEEIFNLLKPVGLLVLLNESIDVLDPKVVVRKTSELLTRERTDGSMHTSIDFVWLLFEGHAIETIDGSTARPSILLEGPTANSFDWFIPEFNQIQIAWSAFNNTPLRHASVEQIADMPFRLTKSDHATPPEKLKRQEIWERHYNASPYLRHFNDSDVLDHGTKVYQLLLPYFLKDSPRIPMEQLEPLFIKWSDFLQESRRRGLNLRHLQDRL
jgi:hypothetical protein